MNTRSRVVSLTPLGRKAEAKADETLLDAVRRANAPLGNSCGGVGVCARCRVHVLTGSGNLTPPTTIETRVAADQKLAADERLACQAVVLGECEITTPYW